MKKEKGEKSHNKTKDKSECHKSHATRHMSISDLIPFQISAYFFNIII